MVAISVDDPREQVLPDAGWIELEDAEDGTRMLVDTSSSDMRMGLQVAAEEIQIARTRALERARVDHIVLHTDVPYAHELVKAFQMRARRFSR